MTGYRIPPLDGAVDTAFQGKGLGSILLADACRKVAGASAALAVVGMIVDAKDEPAAADPRPFSLILTLTPEANM